MYFTETTECGAPTEIANAYHDGPPGQVTFKLGTMLQFKCKGGFTLSRDAVVRAWCVGGGAWVGPNMTCSRKYIFVQPSIVYVIFTYHQYLSIRIYSKTGVYRGIHYFLIFALKHILWVLVRTASIRRF